MRGVAGTGPSLRVVSLAPGPTEILFALGLGDAVVGISHDSDYPPAARGLPAVTVPAGASADIDGDRLAALAPDVVLVGGPDATATRSREEVRRLVARLDRRPRVYELAPATVGDILSDVKTIGDATGAQVRARELLTSLRTRIDRVTLLTAGVSTWPRVACLDGPGSPRTVGLWVPELVGMAGGYDALAGIGQPARRTTWAEVAAYAPDVLVLMDHGPAEADDLRGLSDASLMPGRDSIPDPRAGRVVSVDARLFTRPGPRIADGLELLAGLLHPNLVRGLTMERAPLC